MLYSLLILFGQFVAQGVVEEKSSRVVELLLATMQPVAAARRQDPRPGPARARRRSWSSASSAWSAALAFDVVDVPGDLIGTVVVVIAWFVLGYAFYAAIFAVAASLVSRQEDLGTRAHADVDGAHRRVLHRHPGRRRPRRHAGDGSPPSCPGSRRWSCRCGRPRARSRPWEVALAVVLMLVAIALIVRLGGRVYAGALLRTGGKMKMREALRAERA